MCILYTPSYLQDNGVCVCPVEVSVCLECVKHSNTDWQWVLWCGVCCVPRPARCPHTAHVGTSLGQSLSVRPGGEMYPQWHWDVLTVTLRCTHSHTEMYSQAHRCTYSDTEMYSVILRCTHSDTEMYPQWHWDLITVVLRCTHNHTEMYSQSCWDVLTVTLEMYSQSYWCTHSPESWVLSPEQCQINVKPTMQMKNFLIKCLR